MDRYELLEEINECLEKLLMCYRVGKQPSDKLLDRLDRLKEQAASLKLVAVSKLTYVPFDPPVG